MSLLEFLHDYSSIPKTLLDALSVSALSAHATCSDAPVCSTDESDCSSDGGGCNTDTCSSDCNDSCSSDCGDAPSCENDESDCYWDSGGCITDDPTCTTDGVTPCSLDGVTPLKKRATVSITDITAYSATVRIVRNDATLIRLFIREDSGNQSTILDTGETPLVQSVATHTITSLSPSTTYAYNLWDDIDGWVGTMYFTTSIAFVQFDWTYAGLDSDGSLVYGSEKQPMLGVYVAAWEWNNLAALVEDVTGSSVSRAISGAPITAAIVNSAATALNVATVTKNVTKISASFFNRLRSAYNSLVPT